MGLYNKNIMLGGPKYVPMGFGNIPGHMIAITGVRNMYRHVAQQRNNPLCAPRGHVQTANDMALLGNGRSQVLTDVRGGSCYPQKETILQTNRNWLLHSFRKIALIHKYQSPFLFTSFCKCGNGHARSPQNPHISANNDGIYSRQLHARAGNQGARDGFTGFVAKPLTAHKLCFFRQTHLIFRSYAARFFTTTYRAVLKIGTYIESNMGDTVVGLVVVFMISDVTFTTRV